MSRAISPRSPRICSAQLRRLPSFPTRRSSDLAGGFNGEAETAVDFRKGYDPEKVKAYELGLKSRWLDQRLQVNVADRKSTRLNSSHVAISYAVFCLKKKKSSGLISFVRA